VVEAATRAIDHAIEEVRMTRAIALAVLILMPAARVHGFCVGAVPNNVLQPGEQCDDGNLVDGDCCTNQCTFPCDDHEFCTVDACTVLGGNDHRCDHDTLLPVGTACTPQTNPCKTAQCAPNGKCGIALPDGTPCPSDGSACTVDVCDRGRCGVAVPCDDANPCTVDACDPIRGCTHQPKSDGTRCDPNQCTIATCTAGVCGNAVPRCNDDDPCTDDLCAGGDCQFVPGHDGAVCGSNDPCHPVWTCAHGTCGGEVCTDGQPCSTDGAACDDGDSCSPTSSCTGGRCAGHCTTPCPTDGNACDDGTDCSPASVCSAGVCTATSCNVGMSCLICGATCQPSPCRCGF
jgi:slime mold repeat-containing protein